MIIIRKNRRVTESAIKHGTEFAKADILAKKALIFQNEIFNAFNSSSHIREAVENVIDGIYVNAAMSFLHNRVKILRPQGVILKPDDGQMEDIALQAANDTQEAIASSHMTKYLGRNTIARKWNIPELVKWAKLYLLHSR